MAPHFQYPNFLLLLAALPLLGLLYFFLLRWKKDVTKKMGDPRLVKAITSNFSLQRSHFKFGLLGVSFIFGVLAVMNLRRPGNAGDLVREGIDIVVALDVSKSMLATDLEPSRLERAKQFIGKLMDAMPNDRIALVIFAGKAYMQMPLTTDHRAAMLYVASAQPQSVPQQGTVISEALKMSLNAFNPNDRRFKAAVLISDGEDHDDEAIQTAKDLATQGMMINTVGIGSPDGAYIFDPQTGENKKDETGATVISKLNEEGLKAIAENTNGVYVRLTSSDEAVNIISKQLSQIETKAFGDVSLMNFKTYYWIFAGVMLLLLVVETFISERKRKTA